MTIFSNKHREGYSTGMDFLLPRREGESLTDWTLRFIADGQRRRMELEQERRRLRDMYHAVTPRENEVEP